MTPAEQGILAARADMRRRAKTDESAVTKAIRALGVIIKTPHIATYLAQYDPMALAQAKEAFYGFADEEIAAAQGHIESTFVEDVATARIEAPTL